MQKLKGITIFIHALTKNKIDSSGKKTKTTFTHIFIF
jgi:hypothetical protein